MLTLKVSLSGPQASQTRVVLQGLFRHNSGPKAVRGSAVYMNGPKAVWGRWYPNPSEQCCTFTGMGDLEESKRQSKKNQKWYAIPLWAEVILPSGTSCFSPPAHHIGYRTASVTRRVLILCCHVRRIVCPEPIEPKMSSGGRRAAEISNKSAMGI